MMTGSSLTNQYDHVSTQIIRANMHAFIMRVQYLYYIFLLDCRTSVWKHCGVTGSIRLVVSCTPTIQFFSCPTLDSL